MAASDKVPLTVTYTPTSGLTSTVTVLGQVLNNGATNWVPTRGDHAIYLATSSEPGAPKTVLDAQTYYITTGPALPDQATGVTIIASSTAARSSSASSATGVAASSQAGSSAPPTTTGVPMTSALPVSSIAAQTQSATPSKSTPNAAPGRPYDGSRSKSGVALIVLFAVGALFGWQA